MFRVLRHYLPLRRALLILSETVLITVVLGLGLSAHLFSPTPGVIGSLVDVGLHPDSARWRVWLSALLLTVLSQVAISFNELYDFRISTSRYDRASRFVASSGSAILVTLSAIALAHILDLRRVLDFPGLPFSQLVQTAVFTMLLAFGLLYVWRSVFHFALRRWNFSARVLILGAGEHARSLAKEMIERPDSGYEPIGLLPEMPLTEDAPRGGNGNGHGRWRERGVAEVAVTEGQGPAVASATSLLEALPETLARGRDESLYEMVQRLDIDLVVVALEDRRGKLPTEELLRCRLAGVAVAEREALYERITGKLAVEAMRPSYLIFSDGFGRSPQSELAKRTLDILLACVGLALTWPLMIATVILVRMDSRGPALFTQERVGRDGRSFTLYKFRSMRLDAEAQTGAVWAQENDPRITRAGRFIRKSRLDELPQLFNILAGDMSLVGPRPERQVFVEELQSQIPYYNQRHIVKPGLTGWAQINYPYGSSVDDSLRKLQFDLFYIKHQSVLFDLSILFNTIKTVVLRRGT